MDWQTYKLKHVNKEPSLRTLSTIWYTNLSLDDCSFAEKDIAHVNKYNRDIMPDKIEAIEKYQNEYYQRCGEYDFLTQNIVFGAIVIVDGETDLLDTREFAVSDIYLLDGQHRLKALMNGKFSHPSQVRFNIVVKRFDSEIQFREAFRIFNHHTQPPDLYLEVDMEIRAAYAQAVTKFLTPYYKLVNVKNKHPIVYKTRKEGAIRGQRPYVCEAVITEKLYENVSIREELLEKRLSNDDMVDALCAILRRINKYGARDDKYSMYSLIFCSYQESKYGILIEQFAPHSKPIAT